jgi:hypothetical protein
MLQIYFPASWYPQWLIWRYPNLFSTKPSKERITISLNTCFHGLKRKPLHCHVFDTLVSHYRYGYNENCHLVLILDILKIFYWLISWFMVFNTTFNNNSAISWRSFILVEEWGVTGENHRPAAKHWIKK